MRWWMPAAIVGALSAIIVAIVAVQEARIESISLEERLRAQLSSAATHDPATVADLAELLLKPEARGTAVQKERLAEGRALAERALMLAPNTAGA